MNNLLISYDLYKPGQNYEAVADAIKGLGPWARIHLSFWFAKSAKSAEQAARTVWHSMDPNDSLLVLNSTDNTAFWFNLKPEVSNFLQRQWYQRAA